MVTIKDIAQEAGVAVSTVSRVINCHPDVSLATKQKVQEVIDRRHFVPNSNAKQLKQQNSTIISIFVKGRFNFLFHPILEKIQHLIEAKGYTGVVNYLDEESNEVHESSIVCNEKKSLGVMFLGGNPKNFQNDFSKISIPGILVTSSGEDFGYENLSSVTTDDYKAASSAISYLIKMGHEKIGIIGGKYEMSNMSEIRLRGAVDELEKYGILFDEALQYEMARYSLEGAYEGAQRLLIKNPELTAIFAMSDVMAIGAMRAIADKGLSIPEDISIIGFDGIDLANYYNPKLTTIRQLQDELAKNSVDILLRQIEKNDKPLHKVLSFELLEGDSVKEISRVNENNAKFEKTS